MAAASTPPDATLQDAKDPDTAALEPGGPRRGRRTFLKLGIAGAILLGAGGGFASWFALGYSGKLAQGDAPIALSVKEFAVVRALCDALFPEEGAFPSALAIGVAQRIDEELWAAPDPTRGQLKDGLQILEHAPPLYGHFHRFTALDRAARLVVFGAMLRSQRATLRQIAVALKQLAHLYYYANPAVWKAIGYDGPFVEKPVPPESHLQYGALLAARRRV